MRVRIKRLLALLLTLAVLFGLAACASQPEVPAEPPVTPDGQGDPDPGGEPDAQPAVTNPLTGLAMRDELAGRRPYAVMINNVKQALPQKGVSRADIVFEFPTEGSTDRMMAVFYDVRDIPAVGTVRSARDYFIDYAQSLDAIYLHYGGSPQAYTAIKQRKIDDLDGINGKVDGLLYWRDKERIKKNGWEHSVFTSGEKILATVAEMGLRTESKRSGDFFAFGAPQMGEGQKAEQVTIPFSNYIAPVFTYDAASGTYLREQYGSAHIDAGAEDAQLAVTNLFVLFTKVSDVPGDSAGRLSVVTAGSGEGYYVTGGRAVPIVWEKADNDAFVSLTDAAGKPLIVAPGNSWMAILGSGRRDKVVIA